MIEKSATERIVEATALINELSVDLAADLVTLSPTDRRHTVRPPGELVTHLRQLNDAVRRVPHVAAFLKIDVEAMEPDINKLVALDSAIRAVEFLLQRLSDTRTTLRADMWDPSLLTYTTCKTLSKRDPDYLVVVEALAPAFKRNRKADDAPEKDKKDDKESTKEKDKAKAKEGEKAKEEEKSAEKEKSSEAAK